MKWPLHGKYYNPFLLKWKQHLIIMRQLQNGKHKKGYPFQSQHDNKIKGNFSKSNLQWTWITRDPSLSHCITGTMTNVVFYWITITTCFNTFLIPFLLETNVSNQDGKALCFDPTSYTFDWWFHFQSHYLFRKHHKWFNLPFWHCFSSIVLTWKV